MFDTSFDIGATIGLCDDSVLSCTVRGAEFADFEWKYRDNIFSLCIAPDMLREFLRQVEQVLPALDEFAVLADKGQDTGEFRIAQGEDGHTTPAAELLNRARRDLAKT